MLTVLNFIWSSGCAQWNHQHVILHLGAGGGASSYGKKAQYCVFVQNKSSDREIWLCKRDYCTWICVCFQLKFKTTENARVNLAHWVLFMYPLLTNEYQRGPQLTKIADMPWSKPTTRQRKIQNFFSGGDWKGNTDEGLNTCKIFFLICTHISPWKIKSCFGDLLRRYIK